MAGLKLKTKDFAKRLIVKTNYSLGNYDKTIWILGDGRSGTTWVSGLINRDATYRDMFEPVHPKRVSAFKNHMPHRYIRPGEVDVETNSLFRSILTGEFCHSSVDRDNHTLFFKGILIKDIFANLLSYAITQNHSHVKPILLMRNPFAVALSKAKKKNWFWETEPLNLLKQKQLFDDHLAPFESLIVKISAKKDFILNQILIWCIINYVPLKQFKEGELHTCFYEDIYENPNSEIANIERYISGNVVATSTPLEMSKISKPSRVVGNHSNIVAGTSPITSWQEEVDDETYEMGLDILRNFGFDKLYNEKGMPVREVLKSIP
ncbi:sulfotransferase domain-containing protein [Alteromonas confluentis]|uniref:Sulfotransferase domain-containing protein n=1 Tax=Alteromonas confluentis TaxID=1656094 RepID=A0A1E7Z903_9ALTE|nr:sulfotransferase domain-containing protein [Alteromonas confluentis]OFC69932.1 hypothetical protein BFC18_15885 [Alteromonas confluentis]